MKKKIEGIDLFLCTFNGCFTSDNGCYARQKKVAEEFNFSYDNVSLVKSDGCTDCKLGKKVCKRLGVDVPRPKAEKTELTCKTCGKTKKKELFCHDDKKRYYSQCLKCANKKSKAEYQKKKMEKELSY